MGGGGVHAGSLASGTVAEARLGRLTRCRSSVPSD
jgi:hypothetical protein